MLGASVAVHNPAENIAATATSNAASAVAGVVTALPVGMQQASQGGAAGLPPLGPPGGSGAASAAAGAGAPTNARMAAIGVSHQIDTSVDMWTSADLDDKDDTDLALAAQVRLQGQVCCWYCVVRCLNASADLTHICEEDWDLLNNLKHQSIMSQFMKCS
jgi:hypothetical protein